MMRVLMTTDTVGGVLTYAVGLARALGDRAEVVLATMGPRPTPAQRRALAGLRVHESDHALEWTRDPWRGVHAAGQWLLALEQAERPDVVHLNGYAHGALPFRAPALVVAHSCVWSWWSAVHGCAPPAAWDIYRREVAKGVHGAAAVVAPTRAMLDAVVRHYGAPRRALVIPNGSPPDAAPATAEPLVFAAGRLWDEAKGLETLARAAAWIPWPVVIAGPTEGPAGQPFEAHGVRLLGPLDPEDVALWMRRAAIYAWPALYEPFGLSVLEAALRGCALVLGDIPSLREVWGDAAVYVPHGDAPALASAVRALAEAPRALASLAAQARARATRFGPEAMAAAYLSLYEALAHSRRAPRPAGQPHAAGPALAGAAPCKS